MPQRDSDGNTRKYPQYGGTGILYKAMKYSKAGTSKTVLNGAAKRVPEFNDEENINRTEDVRAKNNEKISLAIGTNQKVTYRNGNTYLMDDAGKQMHLQQILDVIDARFQDFGKDFFRETGMKITNTKNTLTKAAQDLVPGFVIEQNELFVGSTLWSRKVLHVGRIGEVIETRVCSLFQYNGFKEAYECTKFSDDHLVVRIGGDKGGSVMLSKVGVTVMNCYTPNTPDNFDFIGTFDAKDTYYNLKKSIFSHFEEELKVLCAEKDTSVSVISHKHDNKPVLARVSSNPMADPTNHIFVTADDTVSNIVFVQSHFNSEKYTPSFIVVNTAGHTW
jgi:hypothetical protein